MQNEADRTQRIAETAYTRGTTGLNNTQSDTGRTGFRTVAGMGMESAENVLDNVLTPALQTIYNDRTPGDVTGIRLGGLSNSFEDQRELTLQSKMGLGENWEIHNPVTKERASELLYDAAIGGLLSGIIGGRDVVRTISGNPRSDLALSGDSSLESDSAVDGRNFASFYNHALALARYQELERKYLDGAISPDEADELWELERIRGQFDTSSVDAGNGGVPYRDSESWNRLLEKSVDGGIIKSGRSGALNPDSDGANSHAERYYGLVRKMTTDV